jgi:putative hydrolases of HD superfamily
MELRRDAELVYEIGTMRHVQRTWRQFGGLPFANVAEHTMRVAWLSMLIGTREGADIGKVVQMSLIHDAPETRTGDVHYMSRLYTERNEDKAFDDMLSATSLDWLRGLWVEFEERETLEAKVVKDADTLDVDFELRETASTGSHLPDSFKPIRDCVALGLYTQAGKEMYETLLATDPHSWHLEGKNRATSGDWRNLVQQSSAE